jgi:hypothetical protein
MRRWKSSLLQLAISGLSLAPDRSQIMSDDVSASAVIFVQCGSCSEMPTSMVSAASAAPLLQAGAHQNLKMQKAGLSDKAVADAFNRSTRQNYIAPTRNARLVLIPYSALHRRCWVIDWFRAALIIILRRSRARGRSSRRRLGTNRDQNRTRFGSPGTK